MLSTACSMRTRLFAGRRDLTDAAAALNTKRPPGPGGLFRIYLSSRYLFAAAIRSAFSYISASIGLMSWK